MSEELTEMQKLRGTHIIMKRGDWLLLCGLANITDSKATDDLIKKSERIIKQEYEKRLKDEARNDLFKKIKKMKSLTYKNACNGIISWAEAFVELSRFINELEKECEP